VSISHKPPLLGGKHNLIKRRQLGYTERCHNHCFENNCFRLHYLLLTIHSQEYWGCGCLLFRSIFYVVFNLKQDEVIFHLQKISHLYGTGDCVHMCINMRPRYREGLNKNSIIFGGIFHKGGGVYPFHQNYLFCTEKWRPLKLIQMPWNMK
jgi:hypothetical protein